MKNTREIRWLQLPDLNKVPFDKLSELNEVLCDKFADTIDFIIITGDIFRSGYPITQVTDFLNKLTEIVDKRNIIIIAGDEDADYSEQTVREIAQVRKRMNNDSVWQFTESEKGNFLSRFVTYANYVDKFYGSSLDFDSLNDHIYTCEGTIALLCVNTAYISNGVHVGKQAIDLEEISKLENGQSPCIAIMHHDYYEINEAQRDWLKGKLSELGVSAIMCGHKFEGTSDYAELEDGTSIPICCCSKSEGQLDSSWSVVGIYEYRWKINADFGQINLHEWHLENLTFEIAGSGEFKIRDIYPVKRPNEEKEYAQKNVSDIKHKGEIKQNSSYINEKRPKGIWLYRKELIVILISVVMTLLLICVFRGGRDELHIRFKETTQDDTLVFTNNRKISEAWIQIVGQVAIITKNGEIIKTYLVEEMYEKSNYISNTKELQIRRLDCPLADSCKQTFEQELSALLTREGYEKDEITVKEIGLTAISLPTAAKDGWTPHYYILDGNSLIPLTSEQAEAKMGGTQITEEIWNNAKQALLEEFKMCALRALEEITD